MLNDPYIRLSFANVLATRMRLANLSNLTCRPLFALKEILNVIWIRYPHVVHLSIPY